VTGFPRFSWFALAVLLVAAPERARAQTQLDKGVVPATPQSEGESKHFFHDSLAIWDHSVTASTLGIGDDVQTRNPTYEMSFRAVPRFYLIDGTARTLSLRADVQLIREFTDSDTTTERGEWTFTDAEVWLTLEETVRAEERTKTQLVFRAPWLRFPTSDVSASNGRILGLGLGLGVDQRLPLAGEGAPLFASTLLRPRVSYMYQFSETTVPTSDEVDRVRVTPSGRSLPSDQLGGTAFAEHELNFSLRAETEVAKNLSMVNELGLRYARRHALADNETICGVVDTGCVDVGTTPSAPRWGVSSYFAFELDYDLGKGFIIGAEYANLTGQLGADGQRRNIVYSPDSRISMNLSLVLDQVYDAARGKSPPVANARAATPAF
jgi:hypothetical protein